MKYTVTTYNDFTGPYPKHFTSLKEAKKYAAKVGEKITKELKNI